jgi:N-acetylneuraminic acid mutarotase
MTGVQQWVRRPSLSRARAGLAGATVAGEILAIGGFEPSAPAPFDLVEARSTGWNTRWRQRAALPTPRANLSAAELDGFAYAVGGLGADVDGETPMLDVVERYDPAADSWETCPALPAPRVAPGVVGLDGLLYVVGGEVVDAAGNWDVTGSVIAYDPVGGAWRNLAPMPTPRTRLRVVAAGGHLYAVGGFGNPPVALPVVERYDPARDSWDPVAPMVEPRGLPGAVTARQGGEEVLVVVGGGHGELFTPSFSVTDSTEVYRVEADKWQVLPVRLPRGRVSLVCAVEQAGTVLAIGGATGEPAPTALVQALDLPTG